MYERFQGGGRPDAQQTSRPEAKVAEKQSVSIIVQTIIRDTSSSIQAGVKSTHFITYDGEYHKDKHGTWNRFISESIVGTTDVPLIGKKEGIRNSFKIEKFSADGTRISFWMKGATASVVGVLPDINYYMYFLIDIEERQFSIGGSHDGYPSYVAYLRDSSGESISIYDSQQGFLPALLGSSDIKVSESGSF